MKFTKSFRGARKGEAFPTDFKVGDECPAELERAAVFAGAARTAGAVQTTGVVANEVDGTPAKKKAGRGSTNHVSPQA